MPYRAPLQEFTFILDHVADYAGVAATKRYEEAGGALRDSILGEAAKLCETVLAPLQRVGDVDPARLENGIVVTPRGFADGYRAIAEGGWNSMSADPEYGGMGLPQTLTNAVNEMMSGACLALQLNPLLSQGQIEALEHHASDDIKALYLPKLISGEWCGTMNLTEPQAGSDVGALKTRAEDNGDGSFAITGQKIFISWADNDFSENVCHLLLARLPDGPDGTRGISLFIVPRNIPDDAGKPGLANSLNVVSLEEKLGLHGSPTAVMQFDGATGWMIGEPHQGMKAMFTMMNNARLGVATQGVGIAEAAYQQALAFALERKQGATATPGASIVDHADVRRMLMTMKAEIFAIRALTTSCAIATDLANATGDAVQAAKAAFLTPIAKVMGTDIGIEVANLGVQVHGGMGYIEETGAAQYLRDVRVTSIYEGTNGIQALDLVGRKLSDGGEAAFRMLEIVAGCAETGRQIFPELTEELWIAAENLREATEWLLLPENHQHRAAGATAYLRAFGRVLGGCLHMKAANAEGREGTRVALARFYLRRIMPEYKTLLQQVYEGSDGLYDLSETELASA